MTTLADIAPALARQAIEVPSWAFGNSGTRFKVFPRPAQARPAVRTVEMLRSVIRFSKLGTERIGRRLARAENERTLAGSEATFALPPELL